MGFNNAEKTLTTDAAAEMPDGELQRPPRCR
jgi:hypothetical protein